MICRCVIRQQQIQDSDDESLEISWFSSHPGDRVEQAILSHIRQHSTESFNEIVQVHARIVGIIWFETPKAGLAVVLNTIDDDLLKINYEAYLWSYYTILYNSQSSMTWEDLLEIYQQDHADQVPEEIVSDMNRNWFETSLEGGSLQLEIDNDIHTKIANIFGYLPWSIYFISHGTVNNTSVVLEYTSVEEPINFDEIYPKIIGELDEQFWFLLYNLIRDLRHIESPNRGGDLVKFLRALTSLFMDNLKATDKISQLHDHAAILSSFESSFLYSYVQDALMDITKLPPTLQLAQQLLEFSQRLNQFTYTELARLVEGTVLEIALQLEQINEQEEVILELTSRSQKWGIKHLIAYVESISNLLTSTKDGQKITKKVVNTVKSDLLETWDGILCLVETNLLIGNIKEAVQLRYQASLTITDKSTRRDDIFNATAWALQQGIQDESLFSIAREQLITAIQSSKEEETLINHLDIITQTAIHNNRPSFLTKLYQLFGEIVSQLPHLHYGMVFDHLTSLVQAHSLFTRPYIELLLTKFIVLTQKSKIDKRPLLSDEYFQLVSTIYNTIDPSKPEAKDLLTYITREIIFTATDINDWSVIEEANRRFSLLFGEKNASSILKEIYYQAAVRRTEIPGSELTENDIAIRLFNEAVELSDVVQERDYLIQVIPKIKKAVIKSRSYNSLPNLIILEIKLNKLMNNPWIEQLLDDIKLLLKKGSIMDVNILFAEALSMDLTGEEKHKILAHQLELAEQESDLLTANEVYEKRQQLIEIGGVEDQDHDFLLQNYRAGISELISKADTTNLNKLLFDALMFCVDQKLEEPTLEFQAVLFDSFESLLTEYRTTPTKTLYMTLISLYRKAITHFINSLLQIPIGLATRLIHTSLSLHQDLSKIEYLRNAQLVLRELSLVFSTSTMQPTKIQKEEVSKVCTTILQDLQNADPDYGPIEGIREMCLVYNRIGMKQSLLPHLDDVINHFKKEIVNEPGATTGLALLLYLLAEVHLRLEGEINDFINETLLLKTEKIINFALSLDSTKRGRQQLKSFRTQLQQSPQAFFQEIPFSLDQYLEIFDHFYP